MALFVIGVIAEGNLSSVSSSTARRALHFMSL